MVINRIERPDLVPQQALIPTQLIKRESCQALQEARIARRIS
jgi:DNA-binding LacI/PurR family transcriptional regulator